MVMLPRRNMDGTFDSVSDAYEFAAVTLRVRHGGRAINYNPDAQGNRGVPKEYAYADAISIWVRAEACDPGDDRRPSWFLAYWLPDATEPQPMWTGREMTKLVKAIEDFECELCKVNFIRRCGRKKCRKG